MRLRMKMRRASCSFAAAEKREENNKQFKCRAFAKSYKKSADAAAEINASR